MDPNQQYKSTQNYAVVDTWGPQYATGSASDVARAHQKLDTILTELTEVFSRVNALKASLPTYLTPEADEELCNLIEFAYGI